LSSPAMPKPDGWCGAKQQPDPKPSQHPPIGPMVIADIEQRCRDGEAEYGQPLRGFNGIDALGEAYRESLDQSLYLRQAIYEMGELLPLVESLLARFEALESRIEALESRIEALESRLAAHKSDGK